MAETGDMVLTIDVQSMIDRFGKQMPGLTRDNVIMAMRQFMGELDSRVQHNIESMFSRASTMIDPRPPHTSLADSFVATVREDGDLIIGEYLYDLEESPYARILEMGGHTGAHVITPKLATALKIPIASLREGMYEEAHPTEEGLFITTFQVNHPGASIAAYHYILSAVLDMSKQFNDDLELAVLKTLVDSKK